MYEYNEKRDGMVNWNLIDLILNQMSDMQTKRVKNQTIKKVRRLAKRSNVVEKNNNILQKYRKHRISLS